MGNAIIIIGNIASGKTTLAKLIGHQMPTYQYICLDDIRKELLDQNPDMNSVVREREAENLALHMIERSENIIYESTGASKFYHRASMRIKSQCRYFVIKMDANRQTCYERHQERIQAGYFTVAPGYTSREDIKTQINTVADAIHKMNSHQLASSEHFSPLHLLNMFLIRYSKFIIPKPEFER